jgi:hypothetical protein
MSALCSKKAITISGGLGIFAELDVQADYSVHFIVKSKAVPPRPQCVQHFASFKIPYRSRTSFGCKGSSWFDNVNPVTPARDVVRRGVQVLELTRRRLAGIAECDPLNQVEGAEHLVGYIGDSAEIEHKT